MFLYSKWISLPLPTRIKIASEFGIIKKGSTEVFNNQIKSDGYLIKDVEEALTLPALQTYLKTDMDDLSVLFDFLVQKIESPETAGITTTVEVETPPETVTVATTEAKPIVKRGRPKKVK